MFSEKFQDIYFQENALEESKYVFIDGNQLIQRFQKQKNLSICELGFGTGLNFLLTFKAFIEYQQNGFLYYHSIEKYPLNIFEIQKALKPFKEFESEKEHLLKILKKIYYPSIGIQSFYVHPRIRLTIYFDDVLVSLKKIDYCSFDVWYLDGFAPSKNPEMWQQEVFLEMARLSHSETSFATYTSAGWVRRNLEKAGFIVQKIKGFGRKKHMLIGRFSGNSISLKNSSSSIVIIGGGIAGITTSLALLKRGYTVHLFEKNPDLATESSAVPSVIVMPHLHLERTPISDLSLKSFNFSSIYYDFIQKLFPDHPFLFKGIYKFDKVTSKLEKAKQIYCIQNSCIRKWKNGFFIKGYFIDNQILIHLLKQLLFSYENFHFYPNTNIIEFNIVENSIQILESSGRIYNADYIVFCNSHSLKDFFPYIEIQKVRGQLLEIPKSFLNISLKRTLISEIAIVPFEKRITIGSSFEPYLQNYYRTNISDQYILNKIHKNFYKIFELIAIRNENQFEFQLPSEAFIGFRSQSIDYLPNIGFAIDEKYKNYLSNLPHTRKFQYYEIPIFFLQNVFIHSQLGSKGYTLAPLGAEIIANFIDKNPIPLERDLIYQLSPARFLFKQWKQNKKIFNSNYF